MILELAAGLLTLSTPVAAGAAAAIGLALARRPRRSPAFRALFLSASLVTAWLGASALTRQAATPELARRWAALGLAAAALLPPAVHRIAATYGATSSFARWSQRLGWLLALPLVALALGDGLVAPALETRLVTSIQPRPWGLQPLYGSLIWAWVGYWLALWLLGLYETWALAPELGPGRRRSTLWLAAAVALAGGGALDLLPGLGRPVPPFGALPLLAFVVLAAGAFRRPAPEIPDETAREILSVMADGLLVCDARGRIEQVNEALCSLAGRSRRQLIGKSIETVLPGSETGRFEDSATLVPAAGDPVEVRVSASPIRGEGGIRATVVVVRDLRESRRVQELVADRERRLGDIEELAGCGHWTWVAGDETVLGSPGLFRVLDLPEPTKGIRWQTFLQRFDAEDRGALRDGLERALRDRELFEQVGRIRRASGDIRFVHVRGGVDADDAGEGEEPATMTGTVQDVTERREAEARFESLLESAADPMVIVDSEGTITRVNQRLEAEFGYRREELVGQPVEILIPEGRRGEHSRLRAGYMAHPIPRPLGTGVELLGRRKDGSEIPVDIRLSPTSGPDGELVTAAVRNISERKRLEGELSHMAFHDPLTDLPNRAALMNRLRRAVGRARPGDDPSFALLCIGLDRFEDITSSLGHRAGDELLSACAERLQQFELAGDMVARLRDDVFVILQDRLGGVADATRLADRILGELGRRTELAGQEVFVGASVGIALSNAGHMSAEEILRNAETAMHRARRRGQKSYEIFDEKMHEEAAVRLELGMDLQRAVESEQLFLEYQPILSVASGEIRGVEALLRWRHPTQGLIGASELIPLAEETGSIVAIGEWVLNAACRQNLYWQRNGPEPLFVAVNLSVSQLRRREFPAIVRGVLRETGLDPALLHLELTETLLVENSDLAHDALAALRATGAGLCVDDFGVGHSSLSYLQHLPINTLKIDRSFVQPMGQEPKSDSLMAAIIGIAHSLELKAIAEGVESAEQLDSLRSLDCDEYQGYFYSPPLLEQDFTELLQSVAGR